MFACLLACSIVQALSLEIRAHFKYVKHKHRKNECMWRFLHLFSITISVCRFAVVYFPFSMVYVYYHTRWLFRLFECSNIGSHGSAGRFCCDWFHICTFHFHQNNACFVHVFGSRHVHANFPKTSDSIKQIHSMRNLTLHRSLPDWNHPYLCNCHWILIDTSRRIMLWTKNQSQHQTSGCWKWAKNRDTWCIYNTQSAALFFHIYNIDLTNSHEY